MRAIWSRTISFGLVSVPARMYTATEPKELRFHFLDRRDLTPISYDEVRKDTGEHADSSEIARGFELEMAKTLVENLSAPFDPGKYGDRYQEELLDLICAKAKGLPLPEPDAEDAGEAVDLMAALRKSVEATKRKAS